MRPSSNPVTATPQPSDTPIKWKVWLWFIAMLLISLFSWNWAWGILITVWALSALVAGEIHFIESVKRQDSPILYWSLVIVWALSGVYLVIADLAPDWIAQ